MTQYRISYHYLNGEQDYSDIDATSDSEAVSKVKDIELNAKRGEIIVDSVKQIKLFKFTATAYVTAEDEDEAQDEFADNSFSFAADADCEEVEDYS